MGATDNTFGALLATAMLLPFEGAGAVSAIVHDVLALEPTVVGAH